MLPLAHHRTARRPHGPVWSVCGVTVMKRSVVVVTPHTGHEFPYSVDEITTISGTAKSSLINFAISPWPTYEIVTSLFACFEISFYICTMSCLHPIEIVNVAGKLLKVPCGKCYACINKRRFDNQAKVDLHMQKYKYNLFFTATYSDRYLPTYKVSRVSDSRMVIVQKTQRQLFNDVFLRKVCFSYETEEDKRLYELPFQRKFHPTRKNRRAHVGTHFDLIHQHDAFGVLSKRDVQLFLKSIRNETVRKKKDGVLPSDCKFTYYICGEYGPERFRPHYHGIISTNDASLAKFLSKALPKIWTMGDLRVEYSRGSSSGNYCAGYINSFARLPKILSYKPFRPFVVHSIYYGYSPDEDLKRDISEITYQYLAERNYIVDGKLCTISPSLSFQHHLFPRCFRYDESPWYILYLRYTLVSRLADAIVRETGWYPNSVSEIMTYLETRPSKYDISVASGGYTLDYLFRGSTNASSTIRAGLYLSSRFLRLCDRYNRTPREYFEFIQQYYRDKSSYDYLKFCRSRASRPIDYPLEDYVFDYGNISSEEDPSMYLQSTISEKRSSFKRLFYLSSFLGVDFYDLVKHNSSFENSYMYKTLYMNHSRTYENSIKHKKQNEKNCIFEEKNYSS